MPNTWRKRTINWTPFLTNSEPHNINVFRGMKLRNRTTTADCQAFLPVGSSQAPTHVRERSFFFSRGVSGFLLVGVDFRRGSRVFLPGCRDVPRGCVCTFNGQCLKTPCNVYQMFHSRFSTFQDLLRVYSRNLKKEHVHPQPLNVALNVPVFFFRWLSSSVLLSHLGAVFLPFYWRRCLLFLLLL